MKLWILRPINSEAGPWSPWYDKAFGFVVRAESEAAARTLADPNGGDENRGGRNVWLDQSLSTCVELTSDGAAGVVMQDFAAA